jgi:hypothetical protein
MTSIGSIVTNQHNQIVHVNRPLPQSFQQHHNHHPQHQQHQQQQQQQQDQSSDSPVPDQQPCSSRCDDPSSECKEHAQCSKTSDLAQNCSHQARTAEPDVTVDELAGYLDLQLYLPKKMSFMAELMYT